MKKKTSDSPSAVMPILEEVHRIDPVLCKEITENIRRIMDSGYSSPLGAFTDVIAPAETAHPQDRRVASVIAATSEPSKPLTVDRRTWLTYLSAAWAVCIGGLAIADSAVDGVIAKVAEKWYPSSKTIDENFIRELLRLSEDRRDLHEWRKKLLANGQVEQARLISLVTASGEGLEIAGHFVSEENDFAELEGMLNNVNFSDFTRAYLTRTLSHHYRYLGYSETAFKIFEPYINFKSDNVHLNTYILNAKHLNRHLVFHGRPDFGRLLAEDSLNLSESFSSWFNDEIFSLTIRSVAQSVSVGKENIALKSLYLAQQCMASESEKEALEALRQLDVLRGILLFLLREKKDRIFIIRIYGEILWSYGRIAVIAFQKPWDCVVARCLEVFYGEAGDLDTGERALLKDFHALHRLEMSSPVWLQMALIRAMRAEIESSTGASVLRANIDKDKSWSFLSHATLARAYSRLSFQFGEDPACIPIRCTLAHLEDTALQDAISLMIERRTTKG